MSSPLVNCVKSAQSVRLCMPGASQVPTLPTIGRTTGYGIGDKAEPSVQFSDLDLDPP
jgi:hypothetical protein